jgi:SAM-dependent methyltransferase
VLVDHEEMYVARLQDRFGIHPNVRVDCADLTEADAYDRWKEECIDTVVCSNVLEHLEPDEAVLRSFYRTLVPGGMCILIVPAGHWLYTDIDRELGHYRRYSQRELASKMTAAGFEVAYTKRFSRLGALAWAASGHVLRRRHLSPRQMVWFDRLLPIVKMLDWVLPVPGMSLIMVGRKPGRASQTNQDVGTDEDLLCEAAHNHSGCGPGV